MDFLGKFASSVIFVFTMICSDYTLAMHLGSWQIHTYCDLQVMPENFLLGKRPPFPLCNKKINIIIGEPMEFDLPKLRQIAVSVSRDISPCLGWPSTSPHQLDEAAQRCLYTTISEKIRTEMEHLRCFGRDS